MDLSSIKHSLMSLETETDGERAIVDVVLELVAQLRGFEETVDELDSKLSRQADKITDIDGDVYRLQHK